MHLDIVPLFPSMMILQLQRGTHVTHHHAKWDRLVEGQEVQQFVSAILGFLEILTKLAAILNVLSTQTAH